MKRLTMYLSEQQVAQIDAQCQKTGLGVSEVIRRLLDQALAATGGTQKTLPDLRDYVQYLYDQTQKGP